MSILALTNIEPAVYFEPLQRWLRENASDFPGARLTSLRHNTGGSGFSNETLFASVSFERGAASAKHEFVIRFGPPHADTALFPDYDIPRQFRTMKALATHTTVPVAPCRWLGTDPSIFGSTFMVMDRVHGDVPSDNPPHATAGFIVNGSDADRARLWWSSIEAIARVGLVDWRSAGLHFLAWPGSAEPISQHIDSFERIFRWGVTGKSEITPLLDRAVVWLRSHMPKREPLGLLWGDARFANFMYQDYEPAYLMDWEMASLGNPECDLLYFLVHQAITERHHVPSMSRPRLPGFPTDDETVYGFRQLTGSRVNNFEYYWAFNCFKNLSMFQRFLDLHVLSNKIDPANAEEARMNNMFVEDLQKIMS